MDYIYDEDFGGVMAADGSYGMQIDKPTYDFGIDANLETWHYGPDCKGFIAGEEVDCLPDNLMREIRHWANTHLGEYDGNEELPADLLDWWEDEED